MRKIPKQFLRENLLGLSLTLIGLVLLALTGVFYQGRHSFPGHALADGGGLDGPEIEALERQNQASERIVQAVTPAIVNIQSEKIVRIQQSPFFNDPLFRQFFGEMLPAIPRERREHALGSGVIISPDGYILTNNHVIAKASDIKVMLSDNRFFKGKKVGADPLTDVAVVKVEAKNLPTASLGDSSALHVGDTVMAFGNPFGLNFTVTRGIVSAVGRSGLGIERYEDFIQTDTAINPGNSGGALVNVRGQVVGINTAIVPGNQGPQGEGAFIGVGFAIPSNLVKHVTDSLIKTGKVERGYLGILPQDLNPGLAHEFKVPDVAGVLIGQVEPGSPAEKAGLKQGDVIRKFNGDAVNTAERFRSKVAATSPGTEVTLEILRDGRPSTIRVKLGEQPANLVQGGGSTGAPSESTLRGIQVQALTPSIRGQLGLPDNTRGVVISDVDPTSPAAQAGLQQGDVIQSINRQPVNSVADFDRWAAQARGQVLLRVNRGGVSMFLVISPGDENSENP